MGVLGAAAAGAAALLPPRILNMTTPQVGHLPLIALRPFFIVSSTASEISFFALHLKQYPSAIKFNSTRRFRRACRSVHSLAAAPCNRQLVKVHEIRKWLMRNII